MKKDMFNRTSSSLPHTRQLPFLSLPGRCLALLVLPCSSNRLLFPIPTRLLSSFWILTSPEDLPRRMDIYSHDVKAWWDEVDESKVWQNFIYYSLAGAYALIATVALIQLIRIESRVPEYGWTTQKLFHLLNFLVNGVRAVVFVFRREVQFLKPRIFQSLLLDMPGLLFYTTYTLLVLFWAEIYHQARSLPSDNLRPTFLIINGVVYVVQILVWLILWWRPLTFLDSFSRIFFAGVSFVAAIGFLLYGGRLFLMLRRFPIESKGRRNKLREVGFVTAICFTCFAVRSVMMAWSAFDEKVDLDVLNHPILNAINYLLVEIAPSALVLYILRKLPPKRLSNQYHPIH